MKSMVNKRRFLTGLGGLLIILALVLVACGGSSTSSGSTPTPTVDQSVTFFEQTVEAQAPSGVTPNLTPITVPAALPDTRTPTAGAIYACGIIDTFASSFTGTDSQNYQVKVALSESDCPKGDVGVEVDQSIEGTVFYTIPQGEVQATFRLENPSGYSLLIIFTAQKIDKVILMGNGAPVELQRQ